MSTSYAQDILPLFRTGDIHCMATKGVRLGDGKWMCDAAGSDGFDDHGNARRVFAALSGGFMPPDAKWQQSQVDIFSQWISDGFQP